MACLSACDSGAYCSVASGFCTKSVQAGSQCSVTVETCWGTTRWAGLPGKRLLCCPRWVEEALLRPRSGTGQVTRERLVLRAPTPPVRGDENVTVCLELPLEECGQGGAVGPAWRSVVAAARVGVRCLCSLLSSQVS